jgi:hypothetical protein
VSSSGQWREMRRASRQIVIATAISAVAIGAGLGVTSISDAAWVRPVALAAVAVSIVLVFALLTPRRTAGALAAGLATAIAIYGVLSGGFGVLDQGPDYKDGKPVTGTGKTVVVRNKVLSGKAKMIEDNQPLRLTTRPTLCNEPSCQIDDLSYKTGDKISGVVCQVPNSDRITNGDDTSHTDDKNPHLVSTTRWLGVKLTSGKLGYFSQAWVEPRFFGSLGLPKCPAQEHS